LEIRSGERGGYQEAQSLAKKIVAGKKATNWGSRLWLFGALFLWPLEPVIGEFWSARIHPYGFDHQMAKRVQKPPLPQL